VQELQRPFTARPAMAKVLQKAEEAAKILAGIPDDVAVHWQKEQRQQHLAAIRRTLAEIGKLPAAPPRPANDEYRRSAFVRGVEGGAGPGMPWT
jgi:hypothetical protein